MIRITALSLSVLAFVGTASVVEAASATAEQKAPTTVEIVVDGGYQPNRIEVEAGKPVRLRFVRKDWSPCSSEVVFPSLGIRKQLPTNEPVEIELPALPEGEVEFECGMKMLKGKLVAVKR